MATHKKAKKPLTVNRFVELNNATISDQLKERIKSQNKIKRAIYNSIKEYAKTVPMIAANTCIESHVVLWYLSTGLRYREVVAVEKTDDDYWKYKLRLKEDK